MKNYLLKFYQILLKDEDLDSFLKKSEEMEKNSNQLLNFTNIIKNTLDVKKDILKHLWTVLISIIRLISMSQIL